MPLGCVEIFDFTGACVSRGEAKRLAMSKAVCVTVRLRRKSLCQQTPQEQGRKYWFGVGVEVGMKEWG